MPPTKARDSIIIPNEHEVFDIFKIAETQTSGEEESIKNFVKYFEGKSFKDFFIFATYYIKSKAKNRKKPTNTPPEKTRIKEIYYSSLFENITNNHNKYTKDQTKETEDDNNIIKKIKNILKNTKKINKDFEKIKINITKNNNLEKDHLNALVPFTKERWLTLNVTGASLLDKVLQIRNDSKLFKHSESARSTFRKILITSLIENNIIKDFPVFTQENADWSGKIQISLAPNKTFLPTTPQIYTHLARNISLDCDYKKYQYRVPLISFFKNTIKTQTILNVLKQYNRNNLEEFYKETRKLNKDYTIFKLIKKNLSEESKEELIDISLVLIDHLQILNKDKNKDAILGEAFPPYLRPSAQADATDPAQEPAQRHTGDLMDVAGPSAQPNPLPLVEHINADDWALLSSLIRETPDDDTLTAFEHPPAAQEPAQRHTDALMDVAGPSAQPNPLPLVEHINADDWALLSSWIQREAADDETLTAFEHPPAAQEPAQRHTGALMDVAGPSAQPNPLPFLEHMSADDWALLSSWIQREAADDETLTAFEHPPAAQEPAQRHTGALMDVAGPSAQPNPLPFLEHMSADDWALLSSWIRETPDDDTLSAALTPFEHPPAAQEPAQRHTGALMDVAGPSAQPNPLPLVEHINADDWALLSSWIRETPDDDTLTAFEHPPAAQEPAQRHTDALMDIARPSALPNIPQTELIAEGGDNLWASSFPKRKHFQEKASTSQEGGFAKRHTQQQQGRYR